MTSGTGKVKGATTFRGLADGLRGMAATLAANVNAVAKEVTAEMVFELIYKTPVDTSLARSNWQVSYSGTPSPVPAYYYGKYGVTAQASSQAAYAKALSVIKSKPPNTTLVVINTAKHINELEQGKSSQAPAGYIRMIELKAKRKMTVKLRGLIDGY